MNKVSRLDIELGRVNGTIVGNFWIGIEAAPGNGYAVRMGIALIGILATLPAALGLAAGFTKQFLGIPAIYDSVQLWNETLMKGSLFVGAPLALVLGVLAIARVGLSRAQDTIKTFVAVEMNPLLLVSLALALGVVALFYGHLLVDGWACLRGITKAC
jgi:hypothetical protein